MSPILKPSPLPGVLVTASQSLPPMIGSLARPSSASWDRGGQVSKFRREVTRNSLRGFLTSFLLPPAWSQWLGDVELALLSPWAGGEERGGILMSVDDSRQVDLAVLNGLPQNWSNSAITELAHMPGPWSSIYTHSGGLAGSMMTASLDLSSTTR